MQATARRVVKRLMRIRWAVTIHAICTPLYAVCLLHTKRRLPSPVLCVIVACRSEKAATLSGYRTESDEEL